LDKTCRVYEVATGTLWKTLEGPAEDLEWLEWLPKGHALAVGSRDTTVHFWDVSSYVHHIQYPFIT
jgi:WD40 repeat protein